MLDQAEARVLDHQRKLHRWASTEPARRFGDVFNLVTDQATLLVAWERVASNRGARTAGVDAVTRHAVQRDDGLFPFLEELRSSLRDGSFRPLPVKQVAIPKKGGKLRYLGIPTLRDRVAQMALKLVLEPIFEADFYPSSYGYRPGRRAQDAIAELHHLTSRPGAYEWVIEGDIKALLRQRRPPDPHGPGGTARQRPQGPAAGPRVPAGRRGRAARWLCGQPDRHAARRDQDSSHAVGNFEFETALTYRRVELPRRPV
jgi:hypothetical protein